MERLEHLTERLQIANLLSISTTSVRRSLNTPTSGRMWQEHSEEDTEN
jgi:hypothetical protein